MRKGNTQACQLVYQDKNNFQKNNLQEKNNIITCIFCKHADLRTRPVYAQEENTQARTTSLVRTI